MRRLITIKLLLCWFFSESQIINTNDTSICGGGVQISATVEISADPTECGVSGQCDPSTLLPAATIGTGSSFTSDESSYNGFYSDAKVQYLYKASELISQGLTLSLIHI